MSIVIQRLRTYQSLAPAMSLRPVDVSFEIGGSVFNNLNALRRLIAASSEDDVHTQAVLAMEQLGTCIPVSPERIDEAVNALGGQTSVRVQNLKASIGIASGGLCRIIRQSTPLLQFFVLCAACKVTVLDEDCGALMFEMLKTSKALAKLPCSAAQIVRMITQVCSQAGLIAPVDMMHGVACAVDEWDPELDIFGRMEAKVLAELLITLFEQMREETVDTIVLTGHQNCVWLASSLLGLFGERACLLITNVAIKGHPGAKLCIHVEPRYDQGWNKHVFKASEDPTKFVFQVSADGDRFFHSDSSPVLEVIPESILLERDSKFRSSQKSDGRIWKNRAIPDIGYLATRTTVSGLSILRGLGTLQCCAASGPCSHLLARRRRTNSHELWVG